MNFINKNVSKIIVMVALAVVEITKAVMDAQVKNKRKK